jgi:hypothetical protein
MSGFVSSVIGLFAPRTAIVRDGPMRRASETAQRELHELLKDAATIMRDPTPNPLRILENVKRVALNGPAEEHRRASIR